MILGVSFAITGCRFIGGGVAGGSYDPISIVKAAKDYAPVIANDRITVSVLSNQGDSPPQLFDTIMHDFSFSQTKVDWNRVRVPGTSLVASYSHAVFELYGVGVKAIGESLPSVFSGRFVVLGVGKVSAESVIMIVNRARATTGLTFVALYASDDTTLYKAVLESVQVWDIRVAEHSIDILGPSEIRRITMK